MTQIFTLAAAPDAATLKEGLAGVTTIDAAAVTRVTTPVLQILLAAVAGGARISGASTPLREATMLLGLAPALGLEESL
jgi:hypothetical protein